MAKNSAKSKAKQYFLLNPKVTFTEMQELIGEEVLDSTIEKYLIEFRQTLGKPRSETPKEISVKKLEAELAFQLENNPNSAVIKSCIDFLKLKETSRVDEDEIDVSKFMKIGLQLNK